jgi:hypothetical protein
MSFTTDPMTQMHDALWTSLEASTVFTSLVKPGNRIKITSAGKDDPIKESPADADLPEVMIVPGEGTNNLNKTSSAGELVRQWKIIISSNRKLVHKDVFPIEWAIIKALNAAREGLGTTFIKRTLVANSAYEPPASSNSGSAVKGWICTINVELTAIIARSEIA